MNNIILSPRSITALRVVRIAAWLAVAFCLGITFAAPALSPALELHAAHPAAHQMSASTCGCSAKQGNIS